MHECNHHDGRHHRRTTAHEHRSSSAHAAIVWGVLFFWVQRCLRLPDKYYSFSSDSALLHTLTRFRPRCPSSQEPWPALSQSWQRRCSHLHTGRPPLVPSSTTCSTLSLTISAQASLLLLLACCCGRCANSTAGAATGALPQVCRPWRALPRTNPPHVASVSPVRCPATLCTTRRRRLEFLGPYGQGQMITPNVDKLAADGLTFQFAWVLGCPVPRANRHRCREAAFRVSRAVHRAPRTARCAPRAAWSTWSNHLRVSNSK